MFKKYYIITLVAICSFLNLQPLHAEYENPYDDVNTEEDMRAPACQESTWYTASSTNTSVTLLSVATGHNSTNTTQEMLFTGKRTIKFIGNVSAQTERNLIVGKVGVSAEIGYGVDKTIEVTAKTYVPAHTTYYCDFGSNIVVTTGYINNRDVYCNVTKKSASLQYTYGPYVGWRS